MALSEFSSIDLRVHCLKSAEQDESIDTSRGCCSEPVRRNISFIEQGRELLSGVDDHVHGGNLAFLSCLSILKLTSNCFAPCAS